MQLKYEIAPENLKTLEIKQIALDKNKFGALTFDRSYPHLHTLRKMLVELKELGYHDELTPNEVQNIEKYEKRLLDFVKRIYDFDPANDTNFNRDVRNRLEDEIENFYNDAAQNLRGPLGYLRNEALQKTLDPHAVEQVQKTAAQLGGQAEEMFAQLQDKLDELNKREQQLESTSGKIGAKALGIYFGKETDHYQGKADGWFKAALVSYIILVLLVIGVAVYYSFLHEGGWTDLSWQEGAAKLVLFAAFWYGVSFVIRNYNVNSHLAAVNRHRAAVAHTLEDFLASNPAATGEMLQHGTDAMFKHAAIGFITKAEKDSGNPLLEIVNKIVNPKSE